VCDGLRRARAKPGHSESDGDGSVFAFPNFDAIAGDKPDAGLAELTSDRFAGGGAITVSRRRRHTVSQSGAKLWPAPVGD